MDNPAKTPAVPQPNRIAYSGELDLAGVKMPCFVLEDGTRVLSGRAMQEALRIREKPEEGGKRGGHILTTFFNRNSLKPFISKAEEVASLEPRICYLGSQQVHGYEATALVDICNAMLEARRQHVKLTPRQEIVAAQCEILLSGLAKVGIIALVDEATGYQYDREKLELQAILKAYVSEEILKWQLTFYNSFYQEIFRLRKWNFTPGDIRKRPGVVGLYTIKYIYNMLPRDVFKTIKAKTPRSAAGNPTARYFQFLTPEVGYEKLKHQIITVNTLMSISRNWAEFEDLFARKFGQRAIDFDEKPEPPKQLPPVKPDIPFDVGLKGLLSIPPPPKRSKKSKPPKDESNDEQAGDLVPA